MEPAAGSELAPVSDPEADLAALTAEIRAAAAQRRRAAGLPEPAPHREAHTGATAGPSRSAVDAGATIRPYGELPSRSRLTVIVQRTVRRALRWYLWPVVERMSAHNRAVSAALAENARQLAVLRMDAERTHRDVDLVHPPRSRTRPS